MKRRDCVRAVILAPGPSVLLVHLVLPDRELWITPGGGIHPGESHREALRRELIEELGRGDLEIGPHVWNRDGHYEWNGERVAEREFFYLVHADPFLPDSSATPDPEERKAMAEFRWWSVADLPAHSPRFAPARLGSLMTDLVERGAPAAPVDTGY